MHDYLFKSPYDIHLNHINKSNKKYNSREINKKQHR